VCDLLLSDIVFLPLDSYLFQYYAATIIAFTDSGLWGVYHFHHDDDDDDLWALYDNNSCSLLTCVHYVQVTILC